MSRRKHKHRDEEAIPEASTPVDVTSYDEGRSLGFQISGDTLAHVEAVAKRLGTEPAVLLDRALRLGLDALQRARVGAESAG